LLGRPSGRPEQSDLLDWRGSVTAQRGSHSRMPATPSLTQRAFGLARKRAGGRIKRAVRRVAGRPLVAWERRTLRPVLSVVVPVYNVEAYLRECLDTVLTQSLHNLEVIAVDDGSTDGCLEILREFERRDARVRVLTQPNSGQGIARNVGVEHAQGEFLTFIDSDDTIPPGSFEHMVDTLRRSGSDFCVGSVRRLRHTQYLRTTWQRTVHQSDRLGTTLDEFPAAMQDIICANRVFRTAFWRDEVGGFRGGIAYEDHVPMLTAYVRATKFDILSKVTYNWRIREDLTSTGQQKAQIQNLRDRIEVKEEAHELLKAEASDFVYDVWVARCLEVDFAPFAAQALDAGQEYRDLLTSAYRTFRDRATERAWDLVRVYPKIRGQLVAESRWEDVEDATHYFLSVQQVPPTTVVDGRLVADLPADRAFAAGLPEHLLRMAPLEAHFEGVVQKVAWGPDHVVLTGWMRHRTLDLTTAPALALSLRSGSDEVALEVEQVTIPEANLWAQLPHAGCALGGFRAEVPYASLTGSTGSQWQLHGTLTTADGIVSAGSFHYSLPGTSAEHPGEADAGAGTRVAARWDPSEGFGFVVVRDAPARRAPRDQLAVHAVEVGDGELRLRVSGATHAALSRAALGNPRVQLDLIDVKPVGDGHVLRFDARVREYAGPPRLAPSGDYELTLDDSPAVAAAELVGDLPLRVRGSDLGLDLALGRRVGKQESGPRVLRLSLVPPLRDDELGSYHQFRLQAAYRRSTAPLTESILLASYLGESCTDSQLAIDRHLAVHRPELERVWGVHDHSTQVPEGARAVLLGSAEWYDAVATSRYLCKNIDFGPWLRLRPEQAYLQTFHGYPFKSMGRDFWRSKGFPPGQVRHFARRASGEWDLILVPSPECEDYYREQYGYRGAVLAAGYPRTDALVTSDAAQVRRDVLARIGVAEDRTVVLYAPTFRDTLTTRVYAARRFDDLDLAELTRALGPAYVVLVRGHNNNQREPDRVGRDAVVVDVTDYPDINELTLAADVAVLDYSSLRFDWAITGKPMVFFVPDLESYFGLRAPLFPFEESAPGPWARTTAEVARHVADLDGLRQRYADEIRAFNERFNALNDGHATERVLATFLDESRPWRRDE
jgi:CDP-glycerol glycerophosphotransferase (TagB/SpsB family)/glycosyltransferase involved in cell wall biosynthesis